MANGIFSERGLSIPKYFSPAKDKRSAEDWVDGAARLYVVLGDKQKDALIARVRATDPDRVGGLRKLLTTGYINLLVLGMTTQFEEHVDIVDGLDDMYAAYAFGTSPPTCSFQIALLNNKYDDQANMLFFLYENCLRASRLAALRTEANLKYADKIISGVVTNLQWSLRAEDESVCMGSMQMLVRNIALVPEYANNLYEPDATVTGLSDIVGISETGAQRDAKAIRQVDVYPEIAITVPAAAGDTPAAAPQAPPAAAAEALAADRAPGEQLAARQEAARLRRLEEPGVPWYQRKF